MTELKLQEFGFEKIYGEVEQDDDQTVKQADWHYYVYQIVDGLALVSNASSIEDNDWFVDVHNTYPIIRITDSAKLSTLISLIRSSIVRDEEIPVTESADEL